MKLTQRRSSTTWKMSPLHSAPRPLRAVRPVQDRAAGEVDARPPEGPAGQHLDRIAVPEHHVPAPLHPLFVAGVDVDRHPAERLAPVDHRAVVVRVRDRDGATPPSSCTAANRGVVEIGDAVPQQVSALARHQQRALADARTAGRCRCPTARGSPCRARISRPAARISSRVVQTLTVRRHVLPLVLADRAVPQVARRARTARRRRGRSDGSRPSAVLLGASTRGRPRRPVRRPHRNTDRSRRRDRTAQAGSADSVEFSPRAPVAQGIEHRPPEAGAQVRILPGARAICAAQRASPGASGALRADRGHVRGHTSLRSGAREAPDRDVERVRNGLEASGVIRRFAAVLNPQLIGRGYGVLVWVTLRGVTRAAMAEIEERFEVLEEITEASRMMGQLD